MRDASVARIVYDECTMHAKCMKSCEVRDAGPVHDVHGMYDALCTNAIRSTKVRKDCRVRERV